MTYFAGHAGLLSRISKALFLHLFAIVSTICIRQRVPLRTYSKMFPFHDRYPILSFTHAAYVAIYPYSSLFYPLSFVRSIFAAQPTTDGNRFGVQPTEGRKARLSNPFTFLAQKSILLGAMWRNLDPCGILLRLHGTETRFSLRGIKSCIGAESSDPNSVTRRRPESKSWKLNTEQALFGRKGAPKETTGPPWWFKKLRYNPLEVVAGYLTFEACWVCAVLISFRNRWP